MPASIPVDAGHYLLALVDDNGCFRTPGVVRNYFKKTPNKVYDVFDISSQPPGGWAGFYRLLEREVSLLDVALTATGTVKIQLVVLRDGTLADFEILQDNEVRFANDLLKILKDGRKWQSAIKDNSFFYICAIQHRISI